jgi:D-threo-aldose 1-dehydrogenase
MDKTRRIDEMCRRHGVPLAAAALQFPLGHPAVAAVIPGAVHPREVERNLVHLRARIPADLWAELKAEGLLHPDAPVPG